MDKRATHKISQKIFPSLKKNLTTGKLIAPLSKVQFDTKFVNHNIISKSNVNTLQHARTYSGLNLYRTKSKIGASSSRLNEISKNQLQKVKPNLQKQQYLHNQQNEQVKLLQIQKSRVSTKHYGVVKAYAANSHTGQLTSINQDRICIVTNLNKNANKACPVSFFAIYDGKNGTNFADYMRDNFHSTLIHEEDFWKNTQNAIKAAILKVQKSFYHDPLYSKDLSSASFVMLVVVDDIGYCVQMGQCHLLISKKMGEQRSRVIQKQAIYKERKLSSLKKLKLQSQRKNKTAQKFFYYNPSQRNVVIRKIQLNSEVDFILLGSEGVFQSTSDQNLLKKTWKTLMMNANTFQNSIHLLAGEMLHSLMVEILSAFSSKNVSAIILLFQNSFDLLEKDENLSLPFIKKE